MLNELKKIQEECDKKSYFIKNKKYHQLKNIDILKHNCFHINNAIAKISRICEQEEHNKDLSHKRIINEVIPDLIIYAVQFANIYKIDLDKIYKKRLDYVFHKYDAKKK